MIKSPASIHDRVRRQQIRYFRRELERAGRRIFNVIKLRRKAAEVVDRSGFRHRRDGGFRHVPMRRNAENRLGFDWQRSANPGPCLGERIIRERIHRIAVSQENSRHRD